MSRPEIFVSVDIEADGPIPGVNNLLSLGAVAFDETQTYGEFSANLEMLPGAVPDPATLKWWKSKPEAWAAAREDPQDPKAALTRFVKWVEALPGRPVFVGFPAAYDFMFTYWYMIRFVGRSPFAHSALDMKTMGMTLLDLPYRRVTKGALKRAWPLKRKHSHVALEDAREQGELFLAMLADAKKRHMDP